jgi:hypothetical protein
MVKLMGFVHSYKLFEYDTVLGTWRDQDFHVKYVSLEYETYQYDISEVVWLMHYTW